MWMNSLQFCSGWKFNTIGANLQENLHERMDELSPKEETTYLSENTLHLVGTFHQHYVLISTSWMPTWLEHTTSKCLWNPWYICSRIAVWLKESNESNKGTQCYCEIMNCVRVTLMLCSFKAQGVHQDSYLSIQEFTAAEVIFHTIHTDPPRRFLLELCWLIATWSNWVYFSCFSLGRKEDQWAWNGGQRLATILLFQKVLVSLVQSGRSGGPRKEAWRWFHDNDMEILGLEFLSN